MRDTRAFQIGGATTPITNAVAATAKVTIPQNCDTIVLFNSSSTAVNFVRVTAYLDPTPPADATANAPTVLLDFPIPPLSQIRIYVGEGYKFIRTIASAADGTTYVTPGTGV